MLGYPSKDPSPKTKTETSQNPHKTPGIRFKPRLRPIRHTPKHIQSVGGGGPSTGTPKKQNVRKKDTARRTSVPIPIDRSGEVPGGGHAGRRPPLEGECRGAAGRRFPVPGGGSGAEGGESAGEKDALNPWSMTQGVCHFLGVRNCG